MRLDCCIGASRGRSGRSGAYLSPVQRVTVLQTARSGESDMTASDAESWARLRLVEGESSAKKWELVSSLGHTTLTVGSNSDCTWVVRGDGVRPIHFSLHWDGNRLRAADVYSAGDVSVDLVPLTSQWRPLEGRVRIEFGRAAMLVETSPATASTPPRSAEHPLESPVQSHKPSDPSLQVTAAASAPPSSAPPAADNRSRSSSPARNTGKETLIGVAPHNLIAARMLENYQAPSVTSELPEGVSAKEARRAERERAERERPLSMKATLVGGIGMAGLGISPTPPPGQARGEERKGTPAAGTPAANATLMGFNMDQALRGAGPQPAVTVGKSGDPRARSESGSLREPDQRTVQGFPEGRPGSGMPSSQPPPGAATLGPSGRRMTQKGMVSQHPGVHPGAVAQAPVRSVSAPPSRGAERIGSAWQEQSADPRAGRTLRGVQEYDPQDGPEGGSQRPPRTGRPGDWGGRDERLSDIPTQMRDPSEFESRKPVRGFPWRYVGVLVLTAVAYFAWLYLLDHM
jgi:hypothetical protein